MKIAFLGGNVEASTVTRYVAAFGLFLASVRKKEVLLLQTMEGAHPKAFENLLGEGKEGAVLKEELGRYMVGGMDYLMEHYRRGSLTNHRIRLASESLLYGHLQYISAGNQGRKEEKGKKMDPSQSDWGLAGKRAAFERILQLANENRQIVLVDAGNSDETGFDASDFDLLVLVMDNSTADFEQLPLDGSVSAYLLCNYHEDAFLNAGNLKRYYGLSEGELLPIYSDEAFVKACEKGELRNLFEGRRWGFRRESEEYFLKSLEQATDKLFELLS